MKMAWTGVSPVNLAFMVDLDRQLDFSAHRTETTEFWAPTKDNTPEP